MLNKIRKDGKHAPFEGGWGITQFEWNPMVSKSATRASKSGLRLITWMDGTLESK